MIGTRKSRLGLRGACAAIGLAMLATLVTGAETKKIWTIDALVRDSALIVHGNVTSARSEWNAAHTHIYTYVTIQTLEELKGGPTGGVVNLRLMGGTVDGIQLAIPEQVGFEIGEETVVFLGPNPQAFFPVAGLQNGKFTVDSVTDSAGAVVKRVRERDMTLVELLAQTRAAVKADEARRAAAAGANRAPAAKAPAATPNGGRP